MGVSYTKHEAFSRTFGLLSYWHSIFLGSFFNFKLALVLGLPAMIHLIQDMLLGTTMPFSPVDRTEIKLLPQNFKLKAAVDISVIVISGILWTGYLSAAN
jgi:hypothetical protein